MLWLLMTERPSAWRFDAPGTLSVPVQPIIAARAVTGKTTAAGPKVADTTPVGAASTGVGAAVSASGVAMGASVHTPVDSAVAPVSDGLRQIDAQLYTTRRRLGEIGMVAKIAAANSRPITDQALMTGFPRYPDRGNAEALIPSNSRGMSAMPPIATQSLRRSETSLCARSRHMRCSKLTRP